MVDILITINGEEWTGAKTFRVNQSMDRAAHSISFDTPMIPPNDEGYAFFQPDVGDEYVIAVNGFVLSAGYIRNITSRSVGDADYSLTVNGESRASDLVDTTHDGQVFWKNVSGATIVEQVLAPYGFAYRTDRPFRVEKELKVDVQDSPWDIIKKIAENNGLTVYTNSENVIIFADAELPGTFYELSDVNASEMSVDKNDDYLFSQIIVKAQSAEGTQSKEIRLVNPNAPRYRPKVLIYDKDDTEQGGFEDYSEYVRRRMNGLVSEVSMRLPFLDRPEDAFYRLNDRVWLVAPTHYIEGAEMVISEITYLMSDGDGIVTELRLTTPEAYTIQPENLRKLRQRQRGIWLWQ